MHITRIITTYCVLSLFTATGSYATTENDINFKNDLAYLERNIEVADPFEKFNRASHKFNLDFYHIVMNPITDTYRVIIPAYGRNRVDSFLNNLKTPLYAVNNLLQRNVKGTFTSLWRFVLNTTFGIGGLYDFAYEAGIHEEKEDFGRTMAFYGAKPGAFLIAPFLGPSTVRDFAGSIVDYGLDPFTYILNDNQQIGRQSAYFVETYSQKKELIENTDKNSLDSYSSFKSLYIQNREKSIERKRNINKLKDN